MEAEGQRARVGISDFAQSELGDIAYVELPARGARVLRGEVVCTVDSLKSSSEIYAPVPGSSSTSTRSWRRSRAARWSIVTRWGKAGW